MIRTSTEILPDGTTVARYKNVIRDNMSHRPRLLMQWGRWACISHNARGDGDSGTYAGALEAYSRWYANNHRHKRMQDARAWRGS